MMDMRAHALAATALPHDAQGLALLQRVADAVDRVDHALAREEVRLEVLDLEQGLTWSPWSADRSRRGSRRPRS